MFDLYAKCILFAMGKLQVIQTHTTFIVNTQSSITSWEGLRDFCVDVMRVRVVEAFISAIYIACGS